MAEIASPFSRTGQGPEALPAETARGALRVSAIALAVLAVAAATPVHAAVHLVVAQDGSGQYTRLQDALAAVPSGNSTPCIIDIKPGTYSMSSISDQFKVAAPYITLNGLGGSASDVVLTGSYVAGDAPNDRYAHATTIVTGHDFTAENITFANTAGKGAGQALAMYAKADRLSFLNCRFLGWQDTLRTEYGRQFFSGCYLEGSVDFIYGHATDYFQNCSIYAKASGYVTAPDTLLAGDYQSKGMVFSQCTITGVTSHSSTLGRPWNAGGLAVYNDCNIGPVIAPAGWTDVHNDGASGQEFFAEHDSRDLNGAPLDVSQRVSWSHQLTDAQAQAYSEGSWLSGPDGWTPSSVPEPASLALTIPALLLVVRRRR